VQLAQQALKPLAKRTLREIRRDATMSNFVFVLDTEKRPLTSCTAGVARSLLKAGKAAIYRRYPFTLILSKTVAASPKPLELKLDPGSKVTGIAIKQGNKVIFGAELQHRGHQMVLCRASGSFDIATTNGRVAGISHKYCKPIHKKDGYSYGF
jgi:hypothetical protein